MAIGFCCAVTVVACGAGRSQQGGLPVRSAGYAPAPGASNAPATSAAFDSCPQPVPLPFDARSAAEARAAAQRAVPLAYSGLKYQGFQVQQVAAASDPAAGDLGSLIKSACGVETQGRTYVISLLFPRMLPSAALSHSVALVSRFPDGWQVWSTYPPGPGGSTTGPQPSAAPTPAGLPSTPPGAAAGPVYLALGDSVPVWNGNGSYPNLIGQHYAPQVPGLQLVNLAVSGESTESMIHGLQTGGGSQLQSAVTFLRSQRSQVRLVTLNIAGNDFLTCDPVAADAATCTARENAAVRDNLSVIVRELRSAAGPGVPIFAMNYFNPYAGTWLQGVAGHSQATQSVTAVVAVNRLLEQIYGGFGIKVADVQSAFHVTDMAAFITDSALGRLPVAVESACRLLDIVCRNGQSTVGADPSAAGAAVIAAAFEAVIGRLPGATVGS